MKKTLSDTWVIFANEMSLSIRQIAFVAVTILLPLFYLFLFGPLLKSVAATDKGFPACGAYNIFVPGLLVQLGLFGTAYVGFSIIARMRMGVLERMRASQASRFAVVFGAILKDDVTLVAQSAIVILLAIPLGVHLNAAGAALVLLLIAVLGCMFASISWAVALTLRSEDSLAGILNTVALPLLLLSGILLPMSLAPRWLRWISDVNPLRYFVFVNLLRGECHFQSRRQRMAAPDERPATGPIRHRPAHLHLPRAHRRRRLLPPPPAPRPATT